MLLLLLLLVVLRLLLVLLGLLLLLLSVAGAMVLLFGRLRLAAGRRLGRRAMAAAANSRRVHRHDGRAAVFALGHLPLLGAGLARYYDYLLAARRDAAATAAAAATAERLVQLRPRDVELVGDALARARLVGAEEDVADALVDLLCIVCACL